MNLEGVNTIIFDLGGVILNIDYNKSTEAFKKLGAENFEQLYSQAQQSDLFDRLETGKIEPDAFRDELRSYLSVSWTNEQINEAWNAMLLDLPAKRLSLLKSLSERYRLFLLSNTNAIHYEAYSQMIQREFGLKDLSELFEEAHYSHILGLRKPDSECFKELLQRHDLEPQKTLFIDDSIQHIEGARRVGLRSYHHTKGDITDLF